MFETSEAAACEVACALSNKISVASGSQAGADGIIAGSGNDAGAVTFLPAKAGQSLRCSQSSLSRGFTKFVVVNECLEPGLAQELIQWPHLSQLQSDEAISEWPNHVRTLRKGGLFTKDVRRVFYGADCHVLLHNLASQPGEATMVYEVAYYVTRGLAAPQSSKFLDAEALANANLGTSGARGNYKLPVAAAGVRSTSQASRLSSSRLCWPLPLEKDAVQQHMFGASKVLQKLVALEEHRRRWWPWVWVRLPRLGRKSCVTTAVHRKLGVNCLCSNCLDTR